MNTCHKIYHPAISNHVNQRNYFLNNCSQALESRECRTVILKRKEINVVSSIRFAEVPFEYLLEELITHLWAKTP
jgi:hypothetical protein